MSHHASRRLATSRPSGCLRLSCSDSFEVLNEPKNWQRLMPGDVVLERADEAQPIGRAARSRRARPSRRGRRAYLAVIGPTPIQEKSATLTPANGSADASPRDCGRRGAAPARAARRAPRRCARRRAGAGRAQPTGVARGLARTGPACAASARSGSSQLVPVARAPRDARARARRRRCSPGRSSRRAAMPPLEQLRLACSAARRRVMRVAHLGQRDATSGCAGQHARLVGRPVLGRRPTRR